jgi:hypothetical protein
MQRKVTLAIGQCSDDEHRMDVTLDEMGECHLILSGGGLLEGGRMTFPCSLSNLRLVGQGMSYQANMADGYVMFSTSNRNIQVCARRSFDERTWTCTMSVDSFVRSLRQLDEAALAMSHGYVA